MSKKKYKKPTFFRMVFKAIKETRLLYRRQMNELAEKHRLLSSHSDWTLIETYIEKCNKNPDLNVKIVLNDGTTIMMNTYKPNKRTIDQQLNDIVIEETY